MRRIKKLFGGIDMTWKKVVIFAVIAAIYTALINQVKVFEDTSFRDIAINPEVWILFAVFIISNCKNYKDAVIKCFVFFLISQPLIYLIEVPFSGEGFGIFRYYEFWFKATLCTLPGAAIAYQIKREDWISVAVLAVANAFLAYMCSDYLKRCMYNFPNHLLSCIFCILLALFFIFIFIKDKKKKLVSLAIVVVFFIGGCLVNGTFAGPSTEVVELEEGNWTYTVDDDSIVDVSLDGSTLNITSKNSGTACVTVIDDAGNERVFYATVNGNNIFISELDK